MLIIHRAERADALIGPLARVLAQPLADAFTAEVIAVPTQGVERWLAQRLSHDLGSSADGEAGICAGVNFTALSRLITSVLAESAEVDPRHDPWAPAALTWPLLEAIDAHLDQEWARPLAVYLDASDRTDDPEARHGRRMALARRVAALFDSYATQRPSLIQAWLDADPGPDDGTPLDLAWQPMLWRAVRKQIGTASPTERLADAVRGLRERADAPGSAHLPARISVFGVTRLPQAHLEVLTAIAVHRDVHIWLPHPSPTLWDRLADAPADSQRRGGDVPTARLPLLASMGRDIVELEHRLLRQADTSGIALRHEHHVGPADPAVPTRLNQLQRTIRADAIIATDGESTDAHDRSIQIHTCHGRVRQVEVLRELVLGLLANDDTLEPRDIVVMCPDVAEFAPIIAGVFASTDAAAEPHPQGWPHPGRQIPIRLADRSLRDINPHLGLLSTLLDLAAGRVEATAVLDLMSSQPVKQRFTFSADDLARIRDWTAQTRIAWGENQTRRERFGLSDVAQGTWQVGLDRLLLGVAMAEDTESGWIDRTLPLDDIASTEIDLAGRLSEFIERLQILLSELTGVRPVTAWLATLHRALDWLTAPAPGEAWQTMQARSVLADVASSANGDVELRLSDLRALLAGRLQGQPTRAGFRTGAMTVCSLEPMRSVPHRVVCLLGMDDAAFPRATQTAGDDILLRTPWIGERDRRSEDRQLLLDAVMSAREHLIVLYSGADERTGARRPPSVPVAELIDVIDQLGQLTSVPHPLQPIDAANFSPNKLGGRGPFSFDQAALMAAVRERSPETVWGESRLLSRPLPVSPRAAEGEVHLKDLIELVENPAKWFLRNQLGVSLPSDSAQLTDDVPIVLDGLEQWAIGDRLLTEVLLGRDPAAAQQAEYRRGWLPPREFAKRELQRVIGRIDPVLQAAEHIIHSDSYPAVGALEVQVDLASGVRLVGTVPGVRGTAVFRATNSKLAPKHRLRAWVQALALAASDTEPTAARSWSAITIGRGPERDQGTAKPKAMASTITAPANAVARKHLDDLIKLRDRARREPLPIPADTAAAYARTRGHGTQEQALAAAKTAWQYELKNDEALKMCWGREADFAVLMEDPRSTERAWAGDEGTRLGAYARRIWDPLLAAEQVRRP